MTRRLRSAVLTPQGVIAIVVAAALSVIGATVLPIGTTVHAQAPGLPTKVPVRGTVPLPGTQQQELANITFPAPYNVFEFLVTCGACHGGQVDQQVAHFGNWAGTSMASAARDPVYRANQVIVNRLLAERTGKDGGGNMCMRCHSPNGWYSGRFDPALNGAGDGSQMLHSILLSTDDEGVPCEACHRTMGGASHQRPDLDRFDPAWNLLADIDDWPHAGNPWVDQDGDLTVGVGNPYGNGALQFADGMTYIGRYPGTVDIYWSDLPISDTLGTLAIGLYSYTGQTYGIYPPGWIDILGNLVGGKPALGGQGELITQFDLPIGPPLNPNGTPNYAAQSVSPEHSTVKHPNAPPAAGFIQTSEFCAGCHEQTMPVLNHGMPQQRTYTEWKYSAFGREGPDNRTCQSCHMPRLSHEYNDTVTGSYNSDPYGEPGGWPYSKPRTNTAVHKLAGANRDLPLMMKALYPEVDIEVVGGGEGAGGMWIGTGDDPRIFPGLLSRRDSMWERNRRTTEITMRDGVDLSITRAPVRVGVTADGTGGVWETTVRVTNTSGHRLPSGFSDGRRMWVNLVVRNGSTEVYRSGFYDDATATLRSGEATQFRRALSPLIDATKVDGNAVMVYERVTGACTQDAGTGRLTGCTPSANPLNEYILFDNRLPPMGFDYAQYRQAGVKFYTYDPTTFVPSEDAARYTAGRNWDDVTYRFEGPLDAAATLSARAEVLFQSHSRDFMDFLREADTSTVRPQGPPRPWSPNYPLDPNYLSEEFGLSAASSEIQTAGFITEPLRDNWGGIAYAAWYGTGKGAPYPVAEAQTGLAVPGQVGGLTVSPQCDPVSGGCTGGAINPDTGAVEAYTQQVTWTPVAGADGYLVWIKYGVGLTTASWDKLAIVRAPQTTLTNTALSVNKTYVYKVEAFNGAGSGPPSLEVVAKTPWDLPLPPETLAFVSSTATSITMSWYDGADNETTWLVFRGVAGQVDPNGFTRVASFASTTLFGGVSFTDDTAGLAPGTCYNYVVEAANSAGNSGWNVNGPVQMCTAGRPNPPAALTATAFNGTRVDLAWTAPASPVTAYRLERATNAQFAGAVSIPIADAAATTFSDLTVLPNTDYWYRLFAVSGTVESAPSDPPATVHTPGAAPAPPSGLSATASPPSPDPPTVTLAWSDNATTETGFVVERALDAGGVPGPFAVVVTLGANATGYTDPTVEPKTTYWYRVAATSPQGLSGYAGPLNVVTPGEIPEAPAGLALRQANKTALSLRWTDLSANETGFLVQCADAAGAVSSEQVRANSTSATVNRLIRDTPYTCQVRAFNADGVSAWSDPILARTRR